MNGAPEELRYRNPQRFRFGFRKIVIMLVETDLYPGQCHHHSSLGALAGQLHGAPSNSALGRRLDNVPPSTDISVVTSKTEGSANFDELFAAHYAALARLLYRVVGDAGWAEELASEAFWKLHRNPPASEHNLPGWLYRTGLRLALDNLKKRRRRVHYEARSPAPEAMLSPDKALEQLERRMRVRQVLAALKPQQAELIVLRGEGYSLAEMASILSVNPSSVGTLLARSDAAFRKEYVNRYGER